MKILVEMRNPLGLFVESTIQSPDQTKLRSTHFCLKLFNCSYFGTYSILYLAVLENKEESGTIDVRVGNLGVLEFQINNF